MKRPNFIVPYCNDPTTRLLLLSCLFLLISVSDAGYAQQLSSAKEKLILSVGSAEPKINGAKVCFRYLQHVTAEIKPNLSALNSLKFWSNPPKFEKVMALPKALLRGTQLLKSIFGNSQKTLKTTSKVGSSIWRAVQIRLARMVGLKKTVRRIPTPKIAHIVRIPSECVNTSGPKKAAKASWKVFASIIFAQFDQVGVTVWIGRARMDSTSSDDNAPIIFRNKRALESSNAPVTPCFNLAIGAHLGDGTFGNVVDGILNYNEVAFKQPKSSNEPEKIIKKIMQEARIQASFSHKHIVETHGVLEDPQNKLVFMVMERMQGSLEKLLKSRGTGLTRSEVIRLALDIAKALQCIYLKNIKHIIKPGNILLCRKKQEIRAKISDFGSAAVLTKGMKKFVGTLCFYAPEVSSCMYNEKADVYSFGATLFNMITNSYLLSAEFDEYLKVERIEQRVDDTPLQQLIIACCRTDPNARPSMSQCLEILKNMKCNNNE